MNNQEGKTYGNAWMHKTLIKMLKYINIHVLYAFIAIFIIPFTVIFSSGAKKTFHYFSKQRRFGRCRSIWNTYRSQVIFGKTVIDKFAMYAGHKFHIHYYGAESYQQLCQRPQALIQLSAHIGCAEILGYSYNNSKPCSVLVYGGEKESLMKYRKSAFSGKNIKMIPVATEDSHSEDIILALERGEVVSAFADRFMSTKKMMISSLYGKSIKLARGPFSLAAVRGLDVVMASAMKERDGSYSAFFTSLKYDKALPLREQRQQLADAYCAEIERLLTKYPLQWFNYSDIWVS